MRGDDDRNGGRSQGEPRHEARYGDRTDRSGRPKDDARGVARDDGSLQPAAMARVERVLADTRGTVALMVLPAMGVGLISYVAGLALELSKLAQFGQVLVFASVLFIGGAMLFDRALHRKLHKLQQDEPDSK